MKRTGHSPPAMRRGSLLLPTLYLSLVLVLVIGGVMSFTLSSFSLARADRDRVAALAAAEAGLNWEVGRLNNRLWDTNDSGNLVVDGAGQPLLDLWPSLTSSPPATAAVRVMATDAAGQWTRRFLVGTTQNPFNVGWMGSFSIISEGQVRAPDGHVVRRRVTIGGLGVVSLFDSVVAFAFSSGASAWSLGGSVSVSGTCGSNGQITGNGGPTITVGPVALWGPNASISGVDTSQVATISRSVLFQTDTTDEAANLLLNGTTSGAGVAGWRPTGYNADGTAIGPSDRFGRVVNSGAELIVAATGAHVSDVTARDFLDGNGQPVLDGSVIRGSGRKLRLKPGVYYFAKIDLGNSDDVEIANDFYRADGVTPLYDANHNPINGPATAADYDGEGNRITLLVDAVAGSGHYSYPDSSIGSGLYAALQGANSGGNVRYRRPGNFRIYAKNTGTFSIAGNASSPVEFSCNILHYDRDAASNPYGTVALSSGCHLYGGLFGWRISMGGGAIVEKSPGGAISSADLVTVAPTSQTGGGIGGGFGGWQWQEITVY